MRANFKNTFYKIKKSCFKNGALIIQDFLSEILKFEFWKDHKKKSFYLLLENDKFFKRPD